MATQTGTTLKTYFNTGDQPTESNFEDLIDSNLNLTDGGTVAGATTFSKQITASAGLDGVGTGIVQGYKTLVLSSSLEDCTLHVSHSGATITVSASVDLKLPTPKLGLKYKFVSVEDTATTNFTVTSTSDGSTGVNLFSGILLNNNAGSTDQKVDVDVLTFVAGTSTEGDWCEVECVGENVVAGDATWHVFCVSDANNGITLA